MKDEAAYITGFGLASRVGECDFLSAVGSISHRNPVHVRVAFGYTVCVDGRVDQIGSIISILEDRARHGHHQIKSYHETDAGPCTRAEALHGRVLNEKERARDCEHKAQSDRHDLGERYVLRKAAGVHVVARPERDQSRERYGKRNQNSFEIISDLRALEESERVTARAAPLAQTIPAERNASSERQQR